MKFITTLVFALALTFAPAMSFAASTPRDVTAGLIMTGDKNEVVLAEFVGTLDTDDECLFVVGLGEASGIAVVTAACDTVTTNQYTVPADFMVTRLITAVIDDGHAGYGCIVNLDVDGANAGVAQTLATDAATGSVTETAQALTLSPGDLLGIQVLDGAAALLCDGGDNPAFHVTVIGYFLD